MISKQHYQFFSNLIFKLTGMVYEEGDYYRLDARLNSLKKKYNCSNFDELVNIFSSHDPQKEKELIIEATNNETYFFRDKKPFEYLTTFYCEDKKAESDMSLKIWSSACSTGQEVYSILIQLMDECPEFIHGLEIDATDISQGALDKAESGNYSNLDVQRGLPIKTLMKYFKNEEDSSWTFKDPNKSKVQFSAMNLLTGLYKANYYDLVFCRNVLIYQNKQNKELVLNKIYDSLRPGGVLILGAGESLLGMSHNFESDNRSGAMVFKKPLK